MIELRKIVIFILVILLLFYKSKLLYAMRNKKGESYIFIILICGLFLLAIATFLDVFVRMMNNENIYFIIKTCFTIGSILYIIGIVLWSKFTKTMIESLEKMALVDGLTGVLNRTGIMKIFHSMVVRKRYFYLIVCDLDGTKQINDTLGHIEGDNFIYNASQVMVNVIGRNGQVSRFGGDEFIIILEQKEFLEVEKTIFDIKEKISVLYPQDYFGISIGYAYFPIDGREFAQLVQVADSRMYKDKEMNKNYYRYLTEMTIN